MKTSFPPDAPYITHEDLPTLTEMKEQAHAMILLGRRIAELTDRQLRRVPLEGVLREAVLEARRLDNFAARKRQLRFVGRLLRSHDTEPLQKALDDLDASLPYVDAAAQAVNDWTERLIAGGRDAIESFLDAAPHAERTRLAQLVRQYAKDVKGIAAETPDAAARQTRARAALAQYVRAELAA